MTLNSYLFKNDGRGTTPINPNDNNNNISNESLFYNYLFYNLFVFKHFYQLFKNRGIRIFLFF